MGVRTSGDNRTLHPLNSSAARVVSGGCQQVAGDALGAHWNARMLRWRVWPSGLQRAGRLCQAGLPWGQPW